MPRNSSGNYVLPAGNPVASDTIIQAAWANSTMADIASAMTDSMDRYGRGGMLAEFKVVDGTVTAPGLAFISQSNLGLFRESASVMGIGAGGGVVARFGATAIELRKPLSGGLTIADGGLTVTGDTSLTGKLFVTGGLGLNAPVSLPVGTAAVPALSFLADLDSGLFSPAADSLSVALGGIEKVRFSATAVELIAPAAFITVTNTSGASLGGFLAKSPPGVGAGISLAGNGNTPSTTSFDIIQDSTGALLKQGANKPMVFSTNNLERFRLDASSTFSTDVYISKTNPTLTLAKPGAQGGTSAVVLGQTNGLNRWALYLGDNATESGGDVGSDFILGRYSDNGTYLGYSIFGKRSNGGVIIPSLTVTQIFGATAAMVGLGNVENKKAVINDPARAASIIAIGWVGTLTLLIDSTYFGSNWPISISGAAANSTLHNGFTSAQFMQTDGCLIAGYASNNYGQPYMRHTSSNALSYLYASPTPWLAGEREAMREAPARVDALEALLEDIAVRLTNLEGAI